MTNTERGNDKGLNKQVEFLTQRIPYRMVSIGSQPEFKASIGNQHESKKVIYAFPELNDTTKKCFL